MILNRFIQEVYFISHSIDNHSFLSISLFEVIPLCLSHLIYNFWLLACVDREGSSPGLEPDSVGIRMDDFFDFLGNWTCWGWDMKGLDLLWMFCFGKGKGDAFSAGRRVHGVRMN